MQRDLSEFGKKLPNSDSGFTVRDNQALRRQKQNQFVRATMKTKPACNHCQGEKTRQSDQVAQLECGHWICGRTACFRLESGRGFMCRIFCAVRFARMLSRVDLHLTLELGHGGSKRLAPNGFWIKIEAIANPQERAE